MYTNNFAQKMMEEMGWAEGQSLGLTGDGLQVPLQAVVRDFGSGLGSSADAGSKTAARLAASADYASLFPSSPSCSPTTSCPGRTLVCSRQYHVNARLRSKLAVTDPAHAEKLAILLASPTVGSVPYPAAAAPSAFTAAISNLAPIIIPRDNDSDSDSDSSSSSASSVSEKKQESKKDEKSGKKESKKDSVDKEDKKEKDASKSKEKKDSKDKEKAPKSSTKEKDSKSSKEKDSKKDSKSKDADKKESKAERPSKRDRSDEKDGDKRSSKRK